MTKKSNFERMIDIIDEVFSTRNDPDQIQVTQSEIEKLQLIHSSTLTEVSNEEGPIIWILMIPTTKQIMTEFLENKISEQTLLNLTNKENINDCLYLCSVTTLPEFRKQGLTFNTCLNSINEMKKDFPISNLFVWPFTNEGKKLATKLSDKTGLPLHFKQV
jgi:hypothetical protein